MGGGSSVDNPRVFSPPPKTVRKRQSTKLSMNLPEARSTEHSERETVQQPQQEPDTQLKWPLPKKEDEEDFVPDKHIDKEQYSLPRSRYERGGPAVRRSIKVTSIKFPYSQKAEKKEADYVESNIYHSAHVQMTMKTKTELWAGMSPSTEMKNLLARLNVAHMESNEIIQQRLEKVSKEAERVLGLIINETAAEQNRLLEYAQGIEARREELHREWLKKYAVELDRWRSIELGRLHEKLEQSKKKINIVLQRKLVLVNEQVDVAKSEIFREEHERQTQEADNIVSGVEEISRQNKMQHIGTEVNTDIHLKIRANAGSKVGGERPKIKDTYYPFLEQEHLDNREEFENEDEY